MGWKVIISPGTKNDPSAFTVDAKFKFDLNGRVHDDEQGQVQYIEYNVDIEGDVVSSTVGADLLAIMDELKEYQPRNVYLELDGTTMYTWLATECVGSPRILAFRTVDQDGNGSSHWRYAFSIYIKQGGNVSFNTSVVALETSLLIVSEGSQVIKKVWRAYAKANSVAKALQMVMSFKPSDKTTHEEIERRFQSNEAVGTWTWELFKNFYIIEEPVQYTGNGKSYVWDYAVSDGNSPPPPIIHRAANEVTRIVVRGVVRGNNPDILEPPPPHFSDNGTTMVRCEAEEERSFPGIEDPIKGIWQRPYMEVWYFAGIGKPPGPNHSSHKALQLIAPADGPIGG